MKQLRQVVWCVCCVILFTASAHGKEPLGVTVEVLAKTGSSWNGALLPEYPEGKPEVKILRIAIPPGVRLPWHKHPVINAGYMTRGELTVTTKKGEKLHLHEGDSIVEVVDTWHYGKNEGDTMAEIVMFYAGVQGEPVTIKEAVEE